MDKIVVKGAREHNLKNLDLEIPRDKLVVVTGLSGSGKSSLAFDTIYAEGQRRYVESLSAYARQFLEQMEKPDVESIEGLSPAIAIEQKTTSRNPRSTIGTVTEIYDYLRLLYARAGRPHCYECGEEIASQTVDQIVQQILALPLGAKVTVMAPLVRGRKGEYRKELEQLRKEGYVRVRVDGEEMRLEDKIVLDKKRKHDIDVVVDRIVLKDNIRKRLADGVETATNLAQGAVKIEWSEGGGAQERMFSQRFACIRCGISYPELAPQMFSFNSPHGACPECDGLGAKTYFDPDLVVPDPELSLNDGAIAPWTKRHSSFYRGMLDSLAAHYKFDMDAPWKKLPAKVRQALLEGSGETPIKFKLEGGDSSYSFKKPFDGVLANLDRRYKESASDAVREDLESYMSMRPCPACKGARLRKEALHVKVGGRTIREATALDIGAAHAWFSSVPLTETERKIADLLLREIVERLGFLVKVGLDYLTLDRGAATLSGGEGQRIRLATQIGSSLVGVLYILDEPSIGLHHRDNGRLIEALARLRDLGNTVIVVEHDADTILAADWVIDMGPGAGEHGGEIVAQGTPERILASEKSLTGRYLSGKLSIPLPKHRRAPGEEKLVVRGARGNNLKGVDAEIPLGLFTCVTGVSGSGKSTLVVDTLLPALAHALYGSKEKPAPHDRIEGLERLDKVIHIDQSPIGRTPRSNPATYTGLFTHIRDLYARLPEAQVRGYGPGRFSFNVKGGRCEACEGDGLIKIEMHFLPDVYVTCEVCGGRRYNRETLEVLFKGKSIAEMLDASVEEALALLQDIPPIRKKLETLADVGLGYIRLGQSATTLSGGEAQRIKLARELSKSDTGRTLYVLDEPTTGLHFADIQKLIEVLQRLAAAGNTIVVIEHNLDVIKVADRLIDLGPEGGAGGGRIVAQGTPEEVAANPASRTGEALRAVLK